jgi:molecular chaperone GrpE (heat shock protein)
MAFNEEQRVDERTLSDNENDAEKSHDTVEEQEVVSQIDHKQKEELLACTREAIELKETCKRVAADFENFKKRVERDRATWTDSAQAEVLRNLLPIVDDFDRAINEYQRHGQESEHASWIAGFDLIRKSLTKFLQNYGVVEIQQSTYFDPELHEAVVQVDSQAHESGAIVEIVQKGYMFNGRLLRVARVTVAK